MKRETKARNGNEMKKENDVYKRNKGNCMMIAKWIRDKTYVRAHSCDERSRKTPSALKNVYECFNVLCRLYAPTYYLV